MRGMGASGELELNVLSPERLVCCTGANSGDPFGALPSLNLGDVYELRGAGAPHRLSLRPLAKGRFEITTKTEVGRPGEHLTLQGQVQFMSEDALVLPLLVLTAVDPVGQPFACYVAPLSPLSAGSCYHLIEVKTQKAAETLAEAVTPTFAPGTHIALHTGAQRAVEHLRPGDLLLTRDQGPQPVRWIGSRTIRAEGSLAPVLIRSGACHNDKDLSLSRTQRLLIYRRNASRDLGQADVMVPVDDLVDGTQAGPTSGGHMTRYLLLFDRPQVFYAEGIAVESMAATPVTQALVPHKIWNAMVPAVAPGKEQENPAEMDDLRHLASVG